VLGRPNAYRIVRQGLPDGYLDKGMPQLAHPGGTAGVAGEGGGREERKVRKITLQPVDFRERFLRPV
jgi:hypothetical protein